MKKKTQISGVIVIVILLALGGIYACKSSPREKAGEEAAEKAIENATGEKVEIENKGADVTIEGEGGRIVMSTGEAVWPSDIPGDVPEFKGAKILRVTRGDAPGGHTWSVFFEGAGIEKLEAYDAALKSAGYKTFRMQAPQGGNVTAEKGNVTVSCIVSEKTCMVSVLQKK